MTIRVRSAKTVRGLSALLLAYVLPSHAWAQTREPPTNPKLEAETTPPDTSAVVPVPAATPEAAVDRSVAVDPATASSDVAASSPSVEDRLKAVEQKIEEGQKRNEELEQTVSALSEQLAAAETASTEDRRLSAWGFMDMTFGKALYEHSNALYALGTPRYWSFMSSGVNVYLKSELTQTLSAMVETRLTFTPIGMSTAATNAYINGAFTQTQGTFSREQAVSRAPYTYFSYHQHGIFIERAHFDWKPKDWFGLRVGRYLTPFGIWNEDHGAPVMLGIDLPNLISYQLMPIHQLGVQIFGNRLLTDSLNFEYALTLSNGRGPIEEYKDLDNNKALGLRAKFTYSVEDLTVRLGGYAFFGRYTDRQDQIDVYLTPSLALDRNHPAPVGASVRTLQSYRETAGTLDAMIQYKGLKVMAELAHRRVLYDTAPLMESQAALLNDVPYGTSIYAANFTGIAYYGMAGYEFDLGRSLGNCKLTPYVGADHLSPDQTLPYLNMNTYRGGINAKPSPYVTAKLEASRIVPRAEEMGSKLWLLLAQTAVSF